MSKQQSLDSLFSRAMVAANRPSRRKQPLPKIEWNGLLYSLKSHKTPVPDLKSMDRMSAILWLNRNTRASGYSKANPLAGLGGIIKVV